MRLLFLVLFLCSLAVPASAITSTDDLDRYIRDLRSEVREINSRISSIESANSNIDRRLSALERQLTNVHGKVDILKHKDLDLSKEEKEAGL